MSTFINSPRVVVLRQRDQSEVRAHHLASARAHLIALGLPLIWVSTIMDEAEAILSEKDGSK